MSLRQASYNKICSPVCFLHNHDAYEYLYALLSQLSSEELSVKYPVYAWCNCQPWFAIVFGSIWQMPKVFSYCYVILPFSVFSAFPLLWRFSTTFLISLVFYCFTLSWILVFSCFLPARVGKIDPPFRTLFLCLV